MFTPLVAIVVALLLILAAFGLIAATRKPREGALEKPWPLEPKQPLLSERVLYARLVEALPRHVVLAQVQLLQALKFKRGQWDAGIANRI